MATRSVSRIISESSVMNSSPAPWFSTEFLLTRAYKDPEWQNYRRQMNTERARYKVFLDQYSRAPVVHTRRERPDNMSAHELLYFNGHNVWYHLDRARHVIYRHGRVGSVLGCYEYPKGSAEYEYIMYKCQRRQPIVDKVFYDHLFTDEDYHG